MTYGLFNFYVSDDSFAEKYFTDELFKDVAYNAKLKNKITKQCSFNYVLLPISVAKLEDAHLIVDFIKEHTSFNPEINLNIYATIFYLVKDKNVKFTFDFITTIDDSKFDIFYSDGSSSKSENAASYATIKLLEESNDEDALYEDLTQKTFKTQVFSGRIDSGTNNIGELTGVKTAIINRGNKQFQILVSDSEYSLKCFREWIYNWKQNGYKGANRKEILNCDLIKSIQAELETSNKIYLFKWTKGHVKTVLNEKCDEIAKGELGINKK